MEKPFIYNMNVWHLWNSLTIAFSNREIIMMNLVQGLHYAHKYACVQLPVPGLRRGPGAWKALKLLSETVTVVLCAALDATHTQTGRNTSNFGSSLQSLCNHSAVGHSRFSIFHLSIVLRLQTEQSHSRWLHWKRDKCCPFVELYNIKHNLDWLWWQVQNHLRQQRSIGLSLKCFSLFHFKDTLTRIEGPGGK